MRYRRKMLSFALALVTGAGAAIGVAGTAHADVYSNIWNTPGYTHLMNGEWAGSEPRCLYADADTGNAEIWRCLNARSEEWLKIPLSVAGNNYFLLQSNWTTLCMAVPSWPVNGTPVIQAPCDANDVRQYWFQIYKNNNSTVSYTYDDNYHIVSLQGALCLDKPEGNTTQGLQLQMWTCANPSTDFGDQHAEQLWQILSRRQY